MHQISASRVALAYMKQADRISPDLIKAFEPYVKDPDDADMVAESVLDSFRDDVHALMLPLPAKMKNLTFQHQDSQTYGFDNKEGAWDEGEYTSLWGKISYPTLATLKGGWRINLQKKWDKALGGQSRSFKGDIPAIPAPTGDLKGILAEEMEKAVQKMPDNNEFDEGIEGSMISDPLYEDNDSDTTHYNRDGEEEETDEGASALYDFKFRIQDPKVTVVDTAPDEVAVRVELPIQIVLSDIISPWDRHARRYR